MEEMSDSVMTPLPKHLEEMRDETFGEWWFIRGGNIHPAWKYKRYSQIKDLAMNLPREAYIDAFNQAASIMLKDMESMAKALENVLPHYAPKDLRYVQAHNIYDEAEEALKTYREKYSKQSEGL